MTENTYIQRKAAVPVCASWHPSCFFSSVVACVLPRWFHYGFFVVPHGLMPQKDLARRPVEIAPGPT